MRTNRRELLMAGLLLSVNWPRALAGVSSASGPRILELVRHRESAKSVGEAYLRVFNESQSIISEAITSTIGLDKADVQEMQIEALESSIGATIRDDFARGRTVNLEGWTMSITECRICALFALVA